MSKTKVGKCRADVALVERGLAESRAKAQALIMAGKVFAGERKLAKPGEAVADDQPLEVRGQDHPWVSRGGLKIGRAACRERVWQYVENPGVGGSLKKKKIRV